MNSDEVLAVFHPHSDDSGQREGSGLLEGVALVLVPLGYCSVFSATQGLIAVFDAAYGDMFVVILNASFFLTGLPCALVQMWTDKFFDLKFGSLAAFQVRMITCFLILIGCGAALTVCRTKAAMLITTTLVGFATCLAHGTLTQLVQLFPPTAIINVQIGLQMSNILALVMVLSLRVNSFEIGESRISRYYLAPVVASAVGLVTWLAFLHRTNEPLARRDASLSSRSSAESESAESLLRPSAPSTTGAESESTLLSKTSALADLPEQYADNYHRDLWYCASTICITIGTTNFIGAFYQYIDSDWSSGTMKISTALVFVQLLANALSRPVALCGQLPFANAPIKLLVTSAIRAASMVVFFVYMASAFKADWFILAYIAITSFLAGLMGTFSYVASQDICSVLPKEYQQEAIMHSAHVMNIALHSAGFGSSIFSILLAITIEYIW